MNRCMPARWVRALCLAFGFTALPFGAADVKAHGPLRYQGVRYELVLTDNGGYPGLRSYFPELSLRP